jgi:RimJ/RimL family protein N-acetyltransferase
MFCVLIGSMIHKAKQYHLTPHTIGKITTFISKEYAASAESRKLFTKLPDQLTTNDLILKKFGVCDFYHFAPLILQPYFLETLQQPVNFTPSNKALHDAAELLWQKWMHEVVGKTCSYCVFDQKTDAFLGTLELQAMYCDATPAKLNIEITGFGMPEQRGSARTKTVLRAILDTLFSQTQIDEVFARVSHKNLRCINFLKKCSFTEITSENHRPRELLFRYTSLTGNTMCNQSSNL